MGKLEVANTDMRVVIESKINAKSGRGYFAVAYRGTEQIAGTRTFSTRHDALRELAKIMRERK